MKRIIVCVKGVPKPGTVKVDPETHTLRRESVELILNPPDRVALELALTLKEQGPFEVIAVSMGPPNMTPLLQRCFALGVDSLYLISDRAFAGSDTLATSQILAETLKKLSPFDLVIMGARSIDGETGQVPSETASLLNLPSLTYVKELKWEGGYFISKRETDYGEEVVEFSPPGIISSVLELPYLRPPSLKRLLKMANLSPEILTNGELNLEDEVIGLKGSPTQVVEVFEKVYSKKGEIFEGETSELVEILIQILKDKGFLVEKGG